VAIAFVITFGLIVGSFLTVCVYRIPASRPELVRDPFDEEGNEKLPEGIKDWSDEELAKLKPEITFNEPKRSLCPQCKTQLTWKENIPLFSYLLQGGKCAHCRASIPVRYPLIEVTTALAGLLTYCYFGLTPTAFVIFSFLCALIVISVIDYDYYIIPDVISKPGMAIGVLVGLTNQFTHWFILPVVPDLMMSLWGLLVGGGFLYGFAKLYLWLRKKDGLGLGDVKLLGMTGAFFGPESAFLTIFIGSFLGAMIGSLLLLFRARKWAKPLPFGPYLALSTFLYIFWSEQIKQTWESFLLYLLQ
jgi:leader peptidase (prepilin peptidase)/N-methyltransferase